MLRLWRQVICDVTRDGVQMLPIIPCFRILEQVSDHGWSSRVIHNRRAFYGIVGGLIYLNSAAALAEVEEVNKDLGRSSNSVSILPSDVSIEFLIENYENISDENAVEHHLDEDIIPETVWSLHSNNPVHLDRIRDGVEAQIYTGPDAESEGPILWSRTATALWNVNSVYTYPNVLYLPPLPFQVASCGGGHAEREDLDHCSIRAGDIFRQEAEKENSSDADSDNNTLGKDSNNTILSIDAASSSNTNNQSTPSLSAPGPISNPLSNRNLIVLDQCDGARVCATVDIDLSATPIDLPIIGSVAPPIDDLAPPIDDLAPSVSPPPQITFLDSPEPEPDLPLVFIPSPLKPIPEASTWVMIMIGFGAMIMLRGGSDLLRIKRILVIAALRVVEKAFNRSSA